MSPPTRHTTTTLSEAVALLALPGHLPVAGGTGVVVAIAQEVIHATDVVDIRAIQELRGVDLDVAGALRIGAAERLCDLADHSLIRERYVLFATACERATTGATRESATLGGNLAQLPQCPVFRRNVSCHKNGGNTCPAQDVENETLSIVEGGPCWTPHSSDPGVALVALDATIEVVGPSGMRSVAAAEFFVLPSQRMDREIALNHGEFILAVRLPAAAGGGLQRFAKLTRPESNYAAVSLASARRLDGEVRLVLGGVSPRPYRVYSSVEEEATTGPLDEETIDGLAERALLDAEPLSNNGYKVELAASLLRAAIRELSS